jgi:DNA primase
MNCKQLNSLKIEEILLSLGHFPSKQNEKEAWFLNPFGSETRASFKVDLRKNMWYLFSDSTGGNNLDLLRKYFHCSISDALEWASEQNFSSFRQPVFLSDEKNYSINSVSGIQNWNLKSYLRDRGLSEKIYSYVKEVHFTINKKKLYAIGFENNSKGYELRNRFYKGAILHKNISIIKNESLKVYVTEGFLDALSVIEMKRNFRDDILILNSVGLVQSSIPYLEKYNEIILLLDNDAAGIKTSKFLLSALPWAADHSDFYKEKKDLNEFLVELKSKKTNCKNGNF